MPIYMPGVSNNMDINGLIKKLMKAKSEPLKRIERDIEKFNLEKDIWKMVRKKLEDLGSKAKRLYDHTNPFHEMLAKSSDEDSFTATANRKAKRGQRKVQVLRLAAGHTIISDSVPKDKRFSGSVFYIKLGKEEIKIDFSSGGTLKELADLMDLQAKKIVGVVLTFDTEDTAIMMLRGQKMGAGSELHFRGDFKTLLETGLLKPGTGSEIKFALKKKDEFGKYLGLPPGNDVFSLKNGVLSLPSGTRIEHILDRPFLKGGKWRLEFEVRVDPVSLAGNGTGTGSGSGSSGTPVDPSNLQIGPDFSVSVDGIRIFGSKLLPTEKDFKPGSMTNSNTTPGPMKPQPGDGKPDYRVLALVDNSGGTRREFKVSAPSVSGVWKSVSVDLDSRKGLEKLTRLAFFSDGRNYRVSFRNIRFRAPADGKYIPKNELTRPQDSLLKIDGIKVRRKNNKIDDLIDGVTLTLKKPGREGTLDIEHDKKLIQKYIYEFLETYNKTLQYLNTVTKYLTREEREKLEKEIKAKTDLMKALEDKDKAALQIHAGKLTGDMQLSRLKMRLRRIMTGTYSTRLGRTLILLSQMGISTGAPGSRWSDLKKNMGSLELDTNKLRDMIDKDVIAVAQIFGYDTNGDGRHDSGAGVSIYQLTRQYVRPGDSIITIKLKSIDTLVKDKRRVKERFERSLKNYEERLRRQWANSETRQKRYRSQMRWLRNQNGNNNQD